MSENMQQKLIKNALRDNVKKTLQSRVLRRLLVKILEPLAGIVNVKQVRVSCNRVSYELWNNYEITGGRKGNAKTFSKFLADGYWNFESDENRPVRFRRSLEPSLYDLVDFVSDVEYFLNEYSVKGTIIYNIPRTKSKPRGEK